MKMLRKIAVLIVITLLGSLPAKSEDPETFVKNALLIMDDVLTECRWVFHDHRTTRAEAQDEDLALYPKIEKCESKLREIFANASLIDVENITNMELKLTIKQLLKIEGRLKLGNLTLDNDIEFVKDEDNYIYTYFDSYSDNDEIYSLKEVLDLMTASDDIAEMNHYWKKISDTINISGNLNFFEYVRAIKEQAKVYNQSGAEFWYPNYSKKQMEELDVFMTDIKPFYQELHAYLRKKLINRYNVGVVDTKGPIPLTLYNQARERIWTKNSCVEDDFPRDVLPEMDKILKEKSLTGKHLFDYAENFYKSIGFNALGEDYYKEHVTYLESFESWDQNIKDYSAKHLSFEYGNGVTFENYMKYHDFFGRIYSAIEKTDLPWYFYDHNSLGAAIGHAATLSAQTAKHLHAIDLLPEEYVTETVAKNVNARLAFKNIYDLVNQYIEIRFITDFLNDKFEYSFANEYYWQLYEEYAGVEPPIDRTEHSMDLPYSLLVDLASNKQLIQNFKETVLSYDIYKAACQRADHTGTLSNCDFSTDEHMGEVFREILKVGASKPFNEAVHPLLPTYTKLSAKALLAYYEPTYQWVKDYNKKNGLSTGWSHTAKLFIEDVLTSEEEAAIFVKESSEKIYEFYDEIAFKIYKLQENKKEDTKEEHEKEKEEEKNTDEQEVEEKEQEKKDEQKLDEKEEEKEEQKVEENEKDKAEEHKEKEQDKEKVEVTVEENEKKSEEDTEKIKEEESVKEKVEEVTEKPKETAEEPEKNDDAVENENTNDDYYDYDDYDDDYAYDDSFYDFLNSIKSEEEEAMDDISTAAEALKEIALKAKKYDVSKFKSKPLKKAVEKLTQVADIFILGDSIQSLMKYKKELKNLFKSKDIKKYKDTSEEPEKVSYNPYIINITKTTNDTKELKYYWREWRSEYDEKAKKAVVDIFDSLKSAAGLLDISTTEFWFKYYGNDYLSKMEDVIQTLQPLYKDLHYFVKQCLIKQHTDEDFSTQYGAIPDHLLQQVLAQIWTNSSIIEDDFPWHKLPPNEHFLAEKKYDAVKLLKVADEFYQSLGFEPTEDTFWSERLKSADNGKVESNCHANINDMTPKVYMKYCERVSYKKLLQAHGYMGRLHYAYEKRNLSAYDFNSYNLEYPVGEAVILSASTPKHSQKIGLITDFEVTHEMLLNRLMRMAIHTLFNLHRYFVHTKVATEFLNGEIEENELIKYYWKYMIQYAGIEPPFNRKQSDFDFPMEFYTDLDKNHQVKKFVSEVLGYQIYERLCHLSGNQGDLSNCDFFGSTKAGNALKKMMALGSSVPRKTVLKSFLLDVSERSGQSLINYYAPLKEWLEEKDENEEKAFDSYRSFMREESFV